MEVSFVVPEALGALLILPFFYVLYRWRPLHASRTAQRVSLAMRLLVVTLLVLTLARPVVARPVDDLDVVFALDQSQSMTPEQQAAAANWVQAAVRGMGAQDQTGIVVFGDAAQVAQPLGSERDPAALATSPSGYTNLEEALRLSSSLFQRPAARRIVVLSDGGQNVGNAEEAARALATRGVETSVLPLVSPPPVPEVAMESLDSPARVREGENFEVAVVLYSSDNTEVTLRLWVDGRLYSEDAVTLEAGPNRFLYRQVATRQGFHPFRARVDAAQDTWAANNELSAFTVVAEKARVLLVAGPEGDPSPIANALRAASIQVDGLAASGIPSSLASLARYDAMVLHNVPATSLSLDQQKTIQDYVRSLGRGLLVIGGKQSYSLGGYTGTPLEETLPVNMTPPSKLERPTSSLVLIMDKSGSMDITGRSSGSGPSVTKMAMAKEAAILASQTLKPTDEVGVLAFEMTTRWVVPIQSLSDPAAPDRVKTAIQGLRADGGTEIFPALQAAYEAIRLRQTQIRHLVLISDGRSFSNGDYDLLATRLRQEGITLSTIAIGDDSDQQLLQKLAQQGAGRYHFTQDPRSIPKLLTEETATAINTRIVSHTFSPKITSASPAVRNFTAQDLPLLGGYVATTLKPSAQMVVASHVDDPVLAQWQYGLGRAMAWTSNVQLDWAGGWLGWNELPRFWAQTLHWAMPSPLETELQVGTTVAGGRATVTADTVNVDGSYGNLLESRAVAVSPNANRQEIALSQTAPGRYEGTLPVAEEGAYMLEVSQYSAGSLVRYQVFGFAVPYSPEYRINWDGEKVLQRLADDTGGHVLSQPEEAFRHDIRPQPRTVQPIWPWLLAMALLLFPLDVAIRRLWPVGGAGTRWLDSLARRQPRRAA